MKQLFILCGLFSVLLSAFAQENPSVDSILKLPVVQIEGQRLSKHSAGQKIRLIDSITVLQSQPLNLGEILTTSSSLQINTYSYNGLSTLSFRGTSVAQSGLFWNGFQINPPNNGQIDLSLIPSAYFNEVKILSGGGSSLYGSGNIGGSIHLGNAFDFNPHTRITASVNAGSFGESGLQGGISYADGKVFLKTAVVGKIAENNFTYTDLSGAPQKLENAALHQWGVMQDVYYRAGKQWMFGGSFWYQENNKELPATLTSKPSDASQFDNSFRTNLSVYRYLENGKISLKTALFADNSHFMDPDTIESVAIDSEIRTMRSISELHYEKTFFKNSTFNAGVSFTGEKASSDYYEGNAKRRQLGMFALWAQEIPAIRWKANLNLRQDLIQNYQVPFTPALGLEGILYRFISAKINVSRNFRVPTFNDQFWVPGGNAELKPEDSWNEEVGLIFDLNMEKLKNTTWMSFTVFNSNVKNWILWVPDGVLWSAQNVQEVWARGGEFEYRSTFSIQPVDIQFVGGYTYTKSTNEKKVDENDQSYQKQLIYVPEHRAFFTASVVIKGFVLSYNQSYTGERYVTRDNEESLPAYTLGNVFLSKIFRFGENRLDVGFNTYNVWNKDYQAVQYNPMPGRNFKVSAKFIFNNHKNNANEM